MKKIITFLLLVAGSALAGMMNISLDEPYEGLRSNSIIEIAYDSSGIWIGSAGGASYRAMDDTTWRTFTVESGLHSTEVSALAASVYNDTTTIVCIATLHTEYAAGQNVPTGDGFSITTDGGASWLPDSLTRPFHANYYGMLAYDLDIYQNDIYGACFYGGLLRSMNGGYTWDNLYLNADDSTDLADSTYRSYSNRYFSVKVDLTLAPDTISVWGGSAAGLIRYVFTNYRDDTKQDSAWAIAHREADIDNSLPGNHVVALATHGRPGKIYDAFVTGNYAYVAHGDEGLRIVNISDPLQPVEVGSVDTAGRVWAVTVDGGYAYIADYGEGFVVVDISDPVNPQLVGDVQTNGFPVNLKAANNNVFVADQNSGLFIFDATDPANPVERNSYTDFGGINDVDIAGDYAYLAAGSDGLVIVNIANLDSLEFVGQFISDTLDVNCKEVTVDSTLAYIADADAGALVVDVSDPANPSLKDNFETPGTARSVFYDNGYIYLTDGTALRAFELTAPGQGDSLVYVGGSDTPGTALNVMVDGDYAYVADNYFGMQIIDVSAPDTMYSDGNFAPVCSTYVWAACRTGVGEAGQRYAVAYSTNYGKTWKTVIEQPAWDFAFVGDSVIVAADDGLYISDDYINWDVITEMEEYDAHGDVVRRYFPSGFYAVEAVGSTFWAGGADGTVFTDDGGQTWQIFRSDIKAESHYAYPSPFSPIASTRQGTTIHYLPPQTTNATIKIYDFNLDLVATVVDGGMRQGGVESDNDVWDGRNDKGEIVANGVYFYNIKLDTGEDWWGKVALIK